MQPPTQGPLFPQRPNQYDFIVSSGKNQSNSWLVTASLKTRITVVVVGLVILLLIGWIGIALLNNSSNSNLQNIVILVEEQNELARISQDPITNAAQETTQNFAVTTRLSLMSDQQAFLSYLSSYSVKPSDQVLSARQSAQTDTSLTAAKANGTYDQTYVSIAQKQLNTYASGLKQAYTDASSAQEKQLLNNAYNHAQLLIKLAQQN